MANPWREVKRLTMEQMLMSILCHCSGMNRQRLMVAMARIALTALSP